MDLLRWGLRKWERVRWSGLLVATLVEVAWRAMGVRAERLFWRGRVMVASDIRALGAFSFSSAPTLERLRGGASAAAAGGGDGVVRDAGGLGVVVAAVPVGRSEDLRVESDL
jgi:hypothetical protein